MQKLELTADTVGPVVRGHPWVYQDGVLGRAQVGDLVELVDGQGRRVAYGLWDEGVIAVRVLGRDPHPLQEVLRERIGRAGSWRARVLPPDTDAWRLVNGEGDGLPGLVVDRYGDLIVLRLYSASWERHLGLVVEALRELPWVARVARRLGVDRVDGRSGLERLWGPPIPESLVVREHGLRFLVRPGEGQKTGLFLDQRENRRWVGSVAAGARVVNLFGYNGGFSVYAAQGGARWTVTVDQSAPALEDARENFRLNGMNPDDHGFEVADVFRWKPDGPADIVICDPPSLARAEKAEEAARRAYRELNTLAGRMVSDGGLLVTASCTARFGEERWWDAVRRGLQEASGAWTVVHRAWEPPDHPVASGHPEGRYLKMAALVRRLSSSLERDGSDGRAPGRAAPAPPVRGEEKEGGRGRKQEPPAREARGRGKRGTLPSRQPRPRRAKK